MVVTALAANDFYLSTLARKSVKPPDRGWSDTPLSDFVGPGLRKTENNVSNRRLE